MKFMGKQNQDYLDSDVQEEIVQALQQTDNDAKQEAQFERLKDKLMIKQHLGGKEKFTVKDQLRDLLMNKCKKHKVLENVNVNKLRENEY
ncbi:UNKNOWN [Stylonychia lemnae]|uniref:Uncharacterized protein n=1 Tax=Stylonychia lemnae TaxID=5949 RepID=A0A078ADP8_STYLE|nr:UNKNOWN [Stylonychia lemnae]|eukprot:CDW79657.1 UNKNOWN [Stylonychia lemnae]